MTFQSGTLEIFHRHKLEQVLLSLFVGICSLLVSKPLRHMQLGAIGRFAAFVLKQYQAQLRRHLLQLWYLPQDYIRLVLVVNSVHAWWSQMHVVGFLFLFCLFLVLWAHKILKWFCFVCYVWWKFTHLVDHAQESPDFCYINWILHLNYGSDLVWVRTNSTTIDNVAKELDAFLRKLALIFIQSS